jgi:hypothetical protein
MCAIEPGPRSTWEAFLWWETRRLGYNAFLACVALISFGGVPRSDMSQARD